MRGSRRSSSASSVLKDLEGSVKRPMPTAIHPMLATSVDDPFDDPEWLFEIKWDGYRAVAFIAPRKVRLVSRNQNDLTAQYSELQSIPSFIKAETAVLDGEIATLDELGPLFVQPDAAAYRNSVGRTSHRLASGYSRPVLRLRSALSGRLRPAASFTRRTQGTAGEDYHPGRSRALFRSFSSGQGAVRRRQKRRDSKAFWPSVGAASTRSAVLASGSRSRSLKLWTASSADTPIQRAAGPISAPLCLACTTKRESSFM